MIVTAYDSWIILREWTKGESLRKYENAYPYPQATVPEENQEDGRYSEADSVEVH